MTDWDDTEKEMTLSAAKICMLYSKIQSLVIELSETKEEVKENMEKINSGTKELFHTVSMISIMFSSPNNNKEAVMQLKRATGNLLREQTKISKKFHKNN